MKVSSGAGALLALAVFTAIPVIGFAQTPDALDVSGKLRFHLESAVSPWAIAGAAAYAGILQDYDAPLEWRQGAAAYGKRLGSTLACAGLRSALAFGLDSALREDPRYFRSHSTGFWRRSGHAVRDTILTRTDSGGETLSVWRLGSAYGSAFLSNEWYPARLNTARLGFLQGSVTTGFGLVGNIAAEFWPDIKKKVLRKK